jgi:hypothetical protein
MDSSSPSLSLPRPRDWPRRDHSAVVQVISLARISLALTQGWASEHEDYQLRRLDALDSRACVEGAGEAGESGEGSGSDQGNRSDLQGG